MCGLSNRPFPVRMVQFEFNTKGLAMPKSAWSASSINDISAGRRGGLRAHLGSGGRTLRQLRNAARQRGLKGRSLMDKAQLEAALAQ